MVGVVRVTEDFFVFFQPFIHRVLVEGHVAEDGEAPSSGSGWIHTAFSAALSPTRSDR